MSETLSRLLRERLFTKLLEDTLEEPREERFVVVWAGSYLTAKLVTSKGLNLFVYTDFKRISLASDDHPNLLRERFSYNDPDLTHKLKKRINELS